LEWFLFGLIILSFVHMVIHWILRGCSKLMRAAIGMRCRRCQAVLEWDKLCLSCARRSQLSSGNWLDDLEAAKRLASWSATHRMLPSDQQRSLIESLERLETGEIPPGGYVDRPTSAPAPSTVPLATPPTVDQTRPTTPSMGQPISQSTTSPIQETVASSSTLLPEPHPLDAPEPAAGVPLRRPTQWLGQMLQAFMERSNIRWVELIAASLIVVCSAGLVISLWAPLSSASRFFPSLVFMVATAAVHGAGQYTLRTWKLKETSRGILQIGLLLIPLARYGLACASRDRSNLALVGLWDLSGDRFDHLSGLAGEESCENGGLSGSPEALGALSHARSPQLDWP
jgi:hypothetical protein